MTGKLNILVAMLLFPTLLSAQEKDTLARMKIELDEVLVTATRTERKLREVPAQVSVINREDIDEIPFSNIDDLLKTCANINVNRSWGIFSKNSSVTMHGLPGSARTLVLIDGFPKNKIGGGSVNWHNINPDNVERIEVIQGPASALYGNNAMGGVINIITRKPVERFEGSVKALVGSYNTLGGSGRVAGNEVKNGKGFYWDVNTFYRHGDGYYLDPPEFMDPTDVKTYLKEYGTGARVGYQAGHAGNIDLFLDYYNELRGAGRQIHVDGGSFESTITSDVRSRYTGRVGNGDLTVLAYFMDEYYHGQKESLNTSNEYRLLDSYTDKKDKGVWATWTRRLLKIHRLTTGVEVKSGRVDGNDIYRTSTDKIRFGSRMDILGLFVQDEIGIIRNRLKIIAGIRSDRARFHDGFQEILEPTSATGFPSGFEEKFNDSQWMAFSPKIALQYAINPQSDIYLSASTGFIPPDLKDLSQTGKINKGFRLANPGLKPETLVNYETGFSRVIANRVRINGSVYVSEGYHFQYMIGTGDTVDTGGSSFKPVLRSENIARVRIIGGQISASWMIGNHFTLNANYAHNDSRIVDFGNYANDPFRDLTGKYMIEVSPDEFYAAITWRYRNFSANLNGSYMGPQWYDDENTILLQDYFLANLRLTQTIKDHFRIWLDVQDILGTVYIDRKGQLSPGRYISGGLQYLF
jgi:iron complex outermembrane receptor protein